VLATVKSAGETVTVVVAEFAGVPGSITLPLATAVFAPTPGVVAVAVMATVALAFVASDPMLQVIAVAPEHVP
jgi:hypothetical protein